MNGSRTSLKDLVDARRNTEVIATSDKRPQPPGDDQAYTAFARGRVGTQPQMMLAFHKCNGEIETFAYSVLTRIRSPDPDSEFTLYFAGAKVRVVGRNLTQLYHYIREHRAVEIVEADRVAAMAADGEPVVTKIEHEAPSW